VLLKQRQMLVLPLLYMRKTSRFYKPDVRTAQHAIWDNCQATKISAIRGYGVSARLRGNFTISYCDHKELRGDSD